MTDAAAIILCAGKGTRMNDDSKNKVCFDCAGIPVIRRIIENMRLGGVSRFVIVIGHQAYSVMDCLDGVDGVIYAYQKEQKGTGHAAMCGLKALSAVGYSGPVIVSMGDKIIAPEVISGLIARSRDAKAVWGVQPLAANFNGGRVVTENGKPYGVVEFADAALMALADAEPEQYRQILTNIKLNPKKAEKVIRKASEAKPCGYQMLCGKRFGAEEILHSEFANAGLYCFDVRSAVEVIGNLGSDNAQGEVYLTDALERFAEKDEAVLYKVEKAEDMLTYSTKPELCDISRMFLRSASDFRADLLAGAMDETLRGLYGEDITGQKRRYLELIDHFIEKYGDRKVILTRAPGRVNLMGRHVDHRGGGINVMAIDRDTLLAVAPREDGEIRLTNVDAGYPDRRFSVSDAEQSKKYEKWIDYLDAPETVEALRNCKGDWANYVKSAVFRAQFETDHPLCGMDIAASGNIPVASGLSSSSSVVVAAMEAVAELNCLNITEKHFIDLCGEGEWFVGSRGGAGDHAAMKCCQANHIIHLNFKPFSVGESAVLPEKYAVIVANSMLQAKKSEGSKDIYNAKVTAYELAFMILKKMYPTCDLREFRDLAKIRPYSEIYRMLRSVPETMTRGGIKALLPEYRPEIERIFSSHADPGVYQLRGVALFGISECVRSERFMELLNGKKYEALGELMKISHDGDRIREISLSDDVLDRLAEENADIALQCGAYGCSTEQIDELCDLLNTADGVLGSELVGAGLGGCVVALAEKEKAEQIIEKLDRMYYDPFGYAHSANVYTASQCSSVMY